MHPGPSVVDEKQLIEKAATGDKEAFGDLYLLHLQPIYRYIYYQVGRHEEAEDLAEQVFIKAWGALPDYDDRGVPFQAWLYRIARNAVIDSYRTRRPTTTLDLQWSLQDPSPGPEATAVTSEQKQLVREALLKLDADYQQILLLRFVMGLSHAEVAAVMGRSEGAARALQHRALAALREQYAET
jgi:RNA polymerase sigma-70 factor, ECF subfamily